MSELVKKLVGDARPEYGPQQRSEQTAPPLINFEFPRKIALFRPIKPREYVDRIASIVLSYEFAEGEWFFGREMSAVSRNLLATGADPDVVGREVSKLESAIRAAMWHAVLTPPEAP